MNRPDIVLVANSPGELSALVKPVVEELKERAVRIILVLTPCQYVSGKEKEFAATIKGLAAVISSDDYKRWAFLGRPPRGITFAKSGAVLFLGGDLAHAVLVAKKLKFPAYAYLNERVAWKNFYRTFFVSDHSAFEKFARRLPPRKLKLVGNLMADSVAGMKKWSPENKVVTFMPGSRKWEIDYMTPFYKKVMEMIGKADPAIKFQLVSSPFIKAHPLEGVKVIEFEKIDNSELIVTIPGTNTAKIAARGIPMVVVFPLNHPEVIPLEGLAEMIGKIPVMGKAFKKMVANLVNNKTRFFALPNQKAGREIVPEIRGIVDPLTVALKVLLLLNQPEVLRRMSEQLIASIGRPGAAKKIVEEICEELHPAV